MTVESLIKSAISDEVNANLDAKIVKEIVEKKVQRLAKQAFNQEDVNLFIAREVKEFLKSWEGRSVLRSVISETIAIKITEE